MYLERVDQLMRQYDDKLYMEGDPHFLPNFPRFPRNPQRAVAVDEVELKERRRAEVEFVHLPPRRLLPISTRTRRGRAHSRS